MNVTKQDYFNIENALSLIDTGTLSYDDLSTYRTAMDTMERLRQKQDATNQKTWAYIKKKRKIDKNYARSHRTRQAGNTPHTQAPR